MLKSFWRCSLFIFFLIHGLFCQSCLGRLRTSGSRSARWILVCICAAVTLTCKVIASNIKSWCAVNSCRRITWPAVVWTISRDVADGYVKARRPRRIAFWSLPPCRVVMWPSRDGLYHWFLIINFVIVSMLHIFVASFLNFYISLRC